MLSIIESISEDNSDSGNLPRFCNKPPEAGLSAVASSSYTTSINESRVYPSMDPKASLTGSDKNSSFWNKGMSDGKAMPNESLMPDNVRLDDSVSPRPDRELVFITPAETPTVSAMATDMPSVPISFSTSPMALSPIFWTPATAWFRYASRLSARTSSLKFISSTASSIFPTMPSPVKTMYAATPTAKTNINMPIMIPTTILVKVLMLPHIFLIFPRLPNAISKTTGLRILPTSRTGSCFP